MSLLDDLINDRIETVEHVVKQDVFQFDNVRSNPYFFGHEKEEELFLKLFHKKELPHGWIFSGPKGIGKATFAFRIAKFLFSQDNQQAGFFGEDKPAAHLDVDMSQPVVQRVISGGHADLLYIEQDDSAKGDIKVDKVREVVEFLRKTSSEGGWRIVIIDNADRMNTAAQNALLKILEEPPKNTLLMLVATTTARLLPTILSRCRVLSFNSISNDDLKQIVDLAPVLSDDGEQTEKLMALSKGSFGRLKELSSGDAFESFQYLLQGLQSFPQLSRMELHNVSDVIGSERGGDKVNSFFDMACWWIEEIVRAAPLGQEYIPLLEEENAFLSHLQMNNQTIDALLTLWEKLKELQTDFNRSSLDQKTVIMTAFLYFENYKTLEKAN